MKLVLCPECTRHARADERACPFCGAPLSAEGAGAGLRPSRGLARAQLYALQSAVAGGVLATAAACGSKDSKATLQDSGNDSAVVSDATATDSAGGPSTPDAPATSDAPAPDAAASQDATASARDADAGGATDAAEERNIVPIPPYGGVFPPGAGDDVLV